ncbi:hypothetical protein B0H13DRAFT_2495307 [Mycena leptocephala]|nr:hypothetical protein B0H13DRAFT_2495307 [Mycena leptocephala]
MDDSIDSYSQSESPPPLPRLTLVLPPLRDVKKAAKKSKSKSKSKQPFAYSEYPDASTSQKVPRPVKLKPLKEVLGRLVVQLKKKDDYAFFLKPVNPAQVPGYSDLVKRPMDLGTMTTKNDFRLVTGNAKIFNPPGSIYHTEADKLEVWGLDQISKASSTVIQYETDWNIEIEKDDAEDEAEDYSMAVDAAAEMEERSRSPSASLYGAGHPALRRGPRGPYNKSSKENPGTAITESIDAEGRLPGSKDGLGAFPPGSDWARTMLALKLKGKRYKTKKERMRVEKDGPPYLPTAALTTTKDPSPYTPATRPIYPPPPQPYPPPTPRDTPTTPVPPSQSYPLPTLLPPSHPEPPVPPSTMKHWTLLRNGAPRRIKDDLPPANDDVDEHARDAHALDFGSFALLAGELAEEMRRRGVALPEGLEDADTLLKGTVRDSVEVPMVAADGADSGDGCGGTGPPVFDPKEYWSTPNALSAEGYIRDVVYGGVDGLAYVRSLAEFVATAPLDVGERVEDDEEDVDMDSVPSLPLGSTLSSWVAQNVVGPLTEGRHELLQRTALELIVPLSSSAKLEDEKSVNPDDDKLPALVSAALHVRPRAAATLAALLQIHSHKIDMAALIRTPAELEQSEEEWAGKGFAANGPTEMNVVLDYVADLEPDVAVDESTGESAVVRNLRLNLLALVKRAPLDTIARLPVDLVPEHIRQYVPTLTTVAGGPQS